MKKKEKNSKEIVRIIDNTLNGKPGEMKVFGVNFNYLKINELVQIQMSGSFFESLFCYI